MKHEISQSEYNALTESIDDRWAYLAKGARPLTQLCALCEEHGYCDDYGIDVGCIIYRDTGDVQCRNTVYYNWRKTKIEHGDDDILTQKIANEMLDYLKDLKERCVVK